MNKLELECKIFSWMEDKISQSMYLFSMLVLIICKLISSQNRFVSRYNIKEYLGRSFKHVTIYTQVQKDGQFLLNGGRLSQFKRWDIRSSYVM
jgi:hypothetical protein